MVISNSYASLPGRVLSDSSCLNLSHPAFERGNSAAAWAPSDRSQVTTFPTKPGNAWEDTTLADMEKNNMTDMTYQWDIYI